MGRGHLPTPPAQCSPAVNTCTCVCVFAMQPHTPHADLCYHTLSQVEVAASISKSYAPLHAKPSEVTPAVSALMITVLTLSEGKKLCLDPFLCFWVAPRFVNEQSVSNERICFDKFDVVPHRDRTAELHPNVSIDLQLSGQNQLIIPCLTRSQDTDSGLSNSSTYLMTPGV